MDYKQLEKTYETAKKAGAKGMLIIKWNPGIPGSEQYIHIMRTPLDVEAAKLFENAQTNRNAGLAKKDRTDTRQFSVTQTQSDFGLPVITYTKGCCIQA